MKKTLLSISKIINYKTLIITALSIISTYITHGIGFSGELPITLVGTAIIFPVVFTISSAYKRREDALMYYASFKANLLGIYLGAKNWVSNEQVPYAQQTGELLIECMQMFQNYFMQNPEKQSILKDEFMYGQFNKISIIIQTLRATGLSTSELSRLDQYLNKGVNDFERLKKIHIYRTPHSLRMYSKFFIYTFPILYAPYFAHHLTEGEPLIGYASSVLYSFVFVSLINIQEQLENPFDNIGEDDIEFNPDEFGRMIKASE